MTSKKSQERAEKYRKQCAMTGQKIAPRHITRLNAYAKNPEAIITKSRKNKYHIKPGTQLIKKYKGMEYIVTVTSPDIFTCNGQTYKTLSAVAQQICGQKVSGYDFFGLYTQRSKE